MNYLQIELFIDDYTTETGEILMAMLDEHPFESFDETETGIRGFIPENVYNEVEITEVLNQLSNDFKFTFKITNIPDENWNTAWESNYSPVLIDNRCYIRAPFHEPLKGIEYEIVIEPKMSFGTAHHETTSMMLSFVLETNWSNIDVLDMGCGTGVLAILASQMGAKSVLAIDNDTWAVENSVENIGRNNVRNVRALLGGKELIADQRFDIILANINRNILLDQIAIYSKALPDKGKLFMSGFYEEDIPIITEEAAKHGFSLKENKIKNNWVAIKMEKSGD